jgi:hypothetical protein
MRTWLWWVALVLVAGTTGCGILGGSGVHLGSSTALRMFYLSKETVQGSQALTACASGYHMASRFEILDVTVLEYDSGKGLTTDDAGSGPPSKAAGYESPGAVGWVRTGGPSQFTDPGGLPGSARTNCATWSTSSPEARGTVAYLSDEFTRQNAAAGVWNGGAQACDVPSHVWCVQNFSAAAGTRSDAESRRGRRH